MAALQAASHRRRLNVLAWALQPPRPGVDPNAHACRTVATVVAGASGAPGRQEVQESSRAITIETPELSAVIPKNNPTHWMTGIEKVSVATIYLPCDQVRHRVMGGG